MRRYDLWFLILAAACLIVGVVMGIAMGVVHDFRLGPVHAHLNLLGWASLALFGLTYRAYPARGATARPERRWNDGHRKQASPASASAKARIVRV